MKKLLIAFAAVALLSMLAMGQTATADIYGTVVLPDGYAIPGVAVTLTGDVTGTRTAVTSEEGNFRFLKLPPGNYQLKFELEGFKTVIQKGVRLFVGKNKNLNIQMETTAINEEVVITGKTCAIDVRKATIGFNITKEMLTSLPTARNPWAILNLVPGMMLDREDVGGNESGQWSSFYGLGSNTADTTWNVDSANITDPSAIGSAPAYLNTNSFEEMQVTLGANDIIAQTGGTQLNFVSRRGGNRFSGDFHLYVEDDAWELTQDLPDSITSKGWVSPGIFRLYQYGVNFGGPIIKDHIWFFGSYGVQDIHSRQINGNENTSWLESGRAKIDFQFGNLSGSAQYSNDVKKKWGRADIGASQQDEGTKWDQVGSGSVYLGNLQYVMGNLMLNAKVAFTDGGFSLDPKGADIDPATGHLVGLDWIQYDLPMQYYGGAYYFYGIDCNSLNLSMDGNYFAEGVLGGDHEIRFGVDYYTATTTSQTLYPNQRGFFIYDKRDPNLYKEIWWIADSIFDVGFKRISFYLSDTATFGKLTANVGIRYDKETGSHNASTAPDLTFNGTPIFTAWLGDLNIPARDIDAAYEVISPRLSLIYDITGDGKNVVKVSFAQYGSQSGNSIAGFQWPAGTREIDVYWADDGDMVPETGEWSENPADWLWWNINELDPYATESANKFDPDFNSPILTEITLAFEKSFGEEMALAINGFYKKNTKAVWDIGMFTATNTYDSPANWYLGGMYTFASGKQAPYYLMYARPNATYRTNHDKEYSTYKAVQLIFSKKMSNGWMLDASFTYSDWKQYYDKSERFDWTNYDYFNEGVVGYQAGGSGLTGVYVNSHWMFKLSGLYQLPWGINITGVFQAREGYVIPYFEQVYRSGGLSWTNMYEPDKKFGDDRLPTFWVLNLGLEKCFKVLDTMTVTFFVDGYNITNNKTTLKVNSRLGISTTDEILRILNPGIFQFGVRLSF